MGIKSIWESNSLYLENDFLKIKQKRKKCSSKTNERCNIETNKNKIITLRNGNLKINKNKLKNKEFKE